MMYTKLSFAVVLVLVQLCMANYRCQAQDKPDSGNDLTQEARMELKKKYDLMTEHWDSIDSIFQARKSDVCLSVRDISILSRVLTIVSIHQLAPDLTSEKLTQGFGGPECTSSMMAVFSGLCGLLLMQEIARDSNTDKQVALQAVELRRDVESLLEPVLRELQPECKDALGKMIQNLGGETETDLLQTLRHGLYYER